MKHDLNCNLILTHTGPCGRLVGDERCGARRAGSDAVVCRLSKGHGGDHDDGIVAWGELPSRLSIEEVERVAKEELRELNPDARVTVDGCEGAVVVHVSLYGEDARLGLFKPWTERAVRYTAWCAFTEVARKLAKQRRKP